MKYGFVAKGGYVPLHVNQAEGLIIYDSDKGVKGIEKVQLEGIQEIKVPGVYVTNLADQYGVDILYSGRKLRCFNFLKRFYRSIKGKRNIAAEGLNIEERIRELDSMYAKKVENKEKPKASKLATEGRTA